MKLYFIPKACSLAVNIVLRELDFDFELIRVDGKSKRMSDGGNFLSVNPHGYVAALQLDDGQVLTEVCAILQYLADLKPQAGLVAPAGTMARVRSQEMLSVISSEIQARFDPFFLDGMPEGAKAILKAKIEKRYDILDAQLAGRAWLVGERYGIADAYFFVIASWSAWFGIDMARWPALAGLMRRVSERPAVQAAMAAEDAAPPVV